MSNENLDSAVAYVITRFRSAPSEDLSFEALVRSQEPPLDLLHHLDTLVRPRLSSIGACGTSITTSIEFQEILAVLRASLERVKSKPVLSIPEEAGISLNPDRSSELRLESTEQKYFSWFDFDDGPLPPSPWEAIPNAVAALDASKNDHETMLKALTDITEIEANEISMDHWRDLMPLLRTLSVPAPATSTVSTVSATSLVREVVNTQFRLFQSSAPRQAAELLENVLSTIIRVEADPSHFFSEEAACDDRQLLVVEWWSRLCRCAHFMLLHIADHLRFLPEKTVNEIMETTFSLLGHGIDLFTCDIKKTSSPLRPTHVTAVPFSGMLAHLDRDATWFLNWCRRTSGSTIGNLFLAQSSRVCSGGDGHQGTTALVVSLLRRSQGFKTASSPPAASDAEGTVETSHPSENFLHCTLRLLSHVAVFHHSVFANTPSFFLAPLPPHQIPSSVLKDIITEISHHFLWVFLWRRWNPSSSSSSSPPPPPRETASSECPSSAPCETGAAVSAAAAAAASSTQTLSAAWRVSAVCCEGLAALAPVRSQEVLAELFTPLSQVLRRGVCPTQQRSSPGSADDRPSGDDDEADGLEPRLRLLAPYLRHILIPALRTQSDSTACKRMVARLLRSPLLCECLLHVHSAGSQCPGLGLDDVEKDFQEFPRVLSATVGWLKAEVKREGGALPHHPPSIERSGNGTEEVVSGDEEDDDRTICSALTTLVEQKQSNESPQADRCLGALCELAANSTGLLNIPREMIAPCVLSLVSRFVRLHTSGSARFRGEERARHQHLEWTEHDRLLLVKCCELSEGYSAVATSVLFAGPPPASPPAASDSSSSSSSSSVHHEDEEVEEARLGGGFVFEALTSLHEERARVCVELLVGLVASPFLAQDLQQLLLSESHSPGDSSGLARLVSWCASVVAVCLEEAARREEEASDSGQTSPSLPRAAPVGEVQRCLAARVLAAACAEFNTAAVVGRLYPSLLRSLTTSSPVTLRTDTGGGAASLGTGLLSAQALSGDVVDPFSIEVQRLSSVMAAASALFEWEACALKQQQASPLKKKKDDGASAASSTTSEEWRSLVASSVLWSEDTALESFEREGGGGGGGGGGRGRGDESEGMVDWLELAVAGLVGSSSFDCRAVIAHLNRSTRARVFLRSPRGVLTCCSIVEALVSQEVPCLAHALASTGVPLSAIVRPWLSHCFANVLDSGCWEEVSSTFPHVPSPKGTAALEPPGCIALATAMLLRDGVSAYVLVSLALLRLAAPSLVRNIAFQRTRFAIHPLLDVGGAQLLRSLGTAEGAVLLARLEGAYTSWINGRLDRGLVEGTSD